ncbi:V-type ATP synthase subunit D [Candidatus Heimdallarchaeota archaeon B3_Heim]|nr:MAG: V-type ATP synthase subunit D [Candidatus Heimdallarchaeota archaeon B3_Heim]
MSTEEIIPGITPTRMQLLELNQRLELATKGYKLLSEKLEALTGELLTSVNVYKERREKALEKTKLAQDEYRKLELQIGTTELRGVVSNFKQVYHLESKKRSLMGISVPMFHLVVPESENTNIASYSLKRTSAKFDENLFLFKESLQAIIQLSEVQSTISRLAKEIIETKRRVNALNYIIIPRIEATVKWIRLTLAERERESFVRLKKVKKKISG